MSLIRNAGTPIRCCSKEEVRQLMDDLCDLFPEVSIVAKLRARAFGGLSYESEIVYRIHNDNDDNEIEIDFCSLDFYREHGYEVVDFVDVFPFDLGEIPADIHDVRELLFGDIKVEFDARRWME